jgi:DNA-binding NarL/FixJ family response regulator
VGPAVTSTDNREILQRLDSPLSRREWEVLIELSQGATNREIARSLGVSVHTVRSYVKTILLKLEARNRTAAATWFERYRNHT